MKQTYPISCMECGFRRSCNSAMYTETCAYYGPEDKKEFNLFKFLSKFFK